MAKTVEDAPQSATDVETVLHTMRANERQSITTPTPVDEALKVEPVAWYAVYKQDRSL